MSVNQWLENFNTILCEGTPEQLFDMYNSEAKVLHYLSENIYNKDEAFMEFCRWYIEQDPCLDFKLTKHR